MKEAEFLDIINDTLDDSSYLGDDCAVTEEGLVITQDSLVEDVHFSLDIITPYRLGYKSVAVNLSDVAAALATPKYITISLSLPNNTPPEFVRQFYQGVNTICKQYHVKVIGGDITGSEKIFISICATGKKLCNYTSSRKNAKSGDVIFTTAPHGESSCGLFLLKETNEIVPSFIRTHLMPIPDIYAAYNLASVISEDIAVMDTSDGLGDALYKLSVSSDVCMQIDYNSLKIPDKLTELANKYKKNIEDWVFWGGEDYHLLCCAPEQTFNRLDKRFFFKIGTVSQKFNKNVMIRNFPQMPFIDKEIFESKSYNHFVAE